MIAIGNRRYSRWALRFVIATVCLTGFWFSLGVLIWWSGPGRHGYEIGLVFAASLLTFLGALAASALTSVDGSVGRRSWRALTALVASFNTLVVFGLATGFVAMSHRLCQPGTSAGDPPRLSFLAPAIVYYLIGYLGFMRPRRLWLMWPFAIALALVALLVVEFIWTTGSGCGD